MNDINFQNLPPESTVVAEDEGWLSCASDIIFFVDYGAILNVDLA
jgi:hypothetical protein